MESSMTSRVDALLTGPINQDSSGKSNFCSFVLDS